LVLIDEAHKAQGEDTQLSDLLEQVLFGAAHSRRVAITATPVELEIDQWNDILGRIKVIDGGVVQNKNGQGNEIISTIQEYVDSVRHLQGVWRSSDAARKRFAEKSRRFKRALSPYLIRRDKREDRVIKKFEEHTKSSLDGYRREVEVNVVNLSTNWKRVVCAAEALSLFATSVTGSLEKRLRLTISNGHGLAGFIDQFFANEADKNQQQYEDKTGLEAINGEKPGDLDVAAVNRCEWWRQSLINAISTEGNELFDHPTILAAVETIESYTAKQEKVLVFGRFNRPLRALSQLLNAREMLRRVAGGQTWPQAKVHGARGDAEWRAVEAANRQLGGAVDLESLDKLLENRYEAERNRLDRLKRRVMREIKTGFLESPSTDRKTAFKVYSELEMRLHDANDNETLNALTKAIHEILDDVDRATPAEFAEAFSEVVGAVNIRDEIVESNGDQESISESICDSLITLLKEEYSNPRATFARTLLGDSTSETREILRQSFNRRHSFPRVLVAQSLVGREGLNLHKACRVVLMLHPEWNPSVAEQQIGRVDRLNSWWSVKASEEMAAEVPADEVSRIEFLPVIFRGTYDEYNWEVLRRRWDDLRAQFHGIVIPPHSAGDSPELQKLAKEISDLAPRFSPLAKQSF
jgi:hypothetical protein